MAEFSQLKHAVELALRQQGEEERFVLAAYFLDGQTLLQIGRGLGVHEATISRKLHRVTDAIREQVLRNLQNGGMSRRAAEEAIGQDPRDLDLNMKKLLQNSERQAFHEEATP